MTHFTIEGQTMNKKVHACIKENAPSARVCTKIHVAGVGYVFYIKNAEMKTVAQVSRIAGGYNNGKYIAPHMQVTIL